jgi:F-type H+-transporting ATPase subunit O
VRNSSFKQQEQEQVLANIRDGLDSQTNNFIDSTLGNRTFNLLPDMIRRYDNLVSLLSVEESIKVISASELTGEQKKGVEGALNDRLSGGKYSVQYEVDPSIVGGLQIYFGDSFLDCSLATRLNRVFTEVEAMTV